MKRSMVQIRVRAVHDRNAVKFSLDSSVGRAVDCSGYRALLSALMCGVTRALLRLGYPSVTGSIPVRETFTSHASDMVSCGSMVHVFTRHKIVYCHPLSENML